MEIVTHLGDERIITFIVTCWSNRLWVVNDYFYINQSFFHHHSQSIKSKLWYKNCFPRLFFSKHDNMYKNEYLLLSYDDCYILPPPLVISHSHVIGSISFTTDNVFVNLKPVEFYKSSYIGQKKFYLCWIRSKEIQHCLIEYTSWPLPWIEENKTHTHTKVHIFWMPCWSFV